MFLVINRFHQNKGSYFGIDMTGFGKINFNLTPGLCIIDLPTQANIIS